MPHDSKTLTLHIAPELNQAVDTLHAKEDKQTKRDSFIRRKTIAKLQESVKDYSTWLKNGRKYSFNTPGGQIIEAVGLQEEPESFAAFEDTDPTKFETETLQIDYPKFVYDQAYNCASLNSTVKALSIKKNPNSQLAAALKVGEIKTVGEWFKQVVFFPVFNDDTVEKAHYQEELDTFEKELEEPETSKAT